MSISENDLEAQRLDMMRRKRAGEEVTEEEYHEFKRRTLVHMRDQIASEGTELRPDELQASMDRFATILLASFQFIVPMMFETEMCIGHLRVLLGAMLNMLDELELTDEEGPQRLAVEVLGADPEDLG